MPTFSVTVLSAVENTELPAAAPLGVSGVPGVSGVCVLPSRTTLIEGVPVGRAPIPSATASVVSRKPLRLSVPSSFLVIPVNSSVLNHAATSAAAPELLADLEPSQ